MFKSELMVHYFSEEEVEDIRNTAFPVGSILENELLSRSPRPLRHLFREDPSHR